MTAGAMQRGGREPTGQREAYRIDWWSMISQCMLMGGFSLMSVTNDRQVAEPKRTQPQCNIEQFSSWYLVELRFEKAKNVSDVSHPVIGEFTYRG